jgi:hypothetical protein
MNYSRFSSSTRHYYSSFPIHPLSLFIHHSSVFEHHSLFCICLTSLPIQHSPFSIPYSQFSINHSSFPRHISWLPIYRMHTQHMTPKRAATRIPPKSKITQKNRGWTQVLAIVKLFLFLIKHPSCYSYSRAR